MALPDLTSNPLIILILTVSIPLAVFFFFTFQFIIPGRLPRFRSKAQPAQPQAAQSQQNPANQVPSTQQEQPKEDPTKPLLTRMDKMQSELVKAQREGVAELKEAIQSLATSLEDTALTLKSAQSDRASPFNLVTEEQHPSEHKEIAEFPAGSVNLPKFIQMCALLEAMEYDNDKIRDLYDLSLLSSEDMELLTRIQEFLSNNKGKYKARDLAMTAYHIAETYRSSSPEMRKFLMTIRGVGDGQ
jgi:anti-sigma28 factor (negative regulator of flagellin synthesis)